MQGPGVVTEFICDTAGTTSHAISFYALPQFLSIRTSDASTDLGTVVAQYSECPRLTRRKVRTLVAGGTWVVEEPTIRPNRSN